MLECQAGEAAWHFGAAGSPQATELGQQIDQLHQCVMWLIVVIFVGLVAVMFYACYAHRKSKGHQAEQFHESTAVEIIWTVIPALILVVIAWPVTEVVIAQKDTSAPDLTIKARGYQWGKRVWRGAARRSEGAAEVVRESEAARGSCFVHTRRRVECHLSFQ